ncbi:hypothetical protein ANABIO32_07800 [Rossellomorea marisflavi]|nr:hypothetical protein ANABIO32_07800 [Rossellomorea marisflavi]
MNFMRNVHVKGLCPYDYREQALLTKTLKTLIFLIKTNFYFEKNFVFRYTNKKVTVITSFV